MNSTPLVALVFNRRHTATTTKEAAVELRVSYQKEQKYMSTGVRLLPKHWRRGMVINRVDAIQLNQTLEKCRSWIFICVRHISKVYLLSPYKS